MSRPKYGGIEESPHPKGLDSLPFAGVAITEGEPKEDRTVNGEDPSVEDVISTHFNHGTLSERLFTPTPLSPMHLSTEPSIYEVFDVNQDHADTDLAPSFEHTECYK
ncbi:hypothetical protein CapIbe_014991 [Capra ibex]